MVGSGAAASTGALSQTEVSREPSQNGRQLRGRGDKRERGGVRRRPHRTHGPNQAASGAHGSGPTSHNRRTRGVTLPDRHTASGYTRLWYRNIDELTPQRKQPIHITGR